jgi:hypothetical protein
MEKGALYVGDHTYYERHQNKAHKIVELGSVNAILEKQVFDDYYNINHTSFF